MIEVREVIRRWKAEQCLREMSRETGLDRNTVRRCVEVLAELGVARDVELDDVLVHEVGKRVQMRATPEASPERAVLLEHREKNEAWLTQKKPLRLTKVHVLLGRDHGVEVSYATLRRFVMDELSCGSRRCSSWTRRRARRRRSTSG